MSSLKNIKTRIRGITSTRKITQAMKIVSASRLKQVQSNIEKTQTYLDIISNLLLDIHHSDESIFKEKSSPYLRKNNSKNVLFIVFSSDKGLCGSFNSRIITATTSALESYKNSGKNVKVVCVGNKVSQYMNIHHKEHVQFGMPFANLNSKNISYSHSALLAKKLQDLFCDGSFDECRILYTKFHSVMKQEVINTQLLPFDINDVDALQSQPHSKEIFEFDDDLSVLLDRTISNFVNAVIFNVYANSITCEYSSRMLAMDGATQNSTKVLKELNLLYNRSRQMLITKELIEIISGAEAIN
jgi:F-type H+-transporting ATPase subunit gamma